MILVCFSPKETEWWIVDLLGKMVEVKMIVTKIRLSKYILGGKMNRVKTAGS